MQAADIRAAFLAFFQERQHEIVPSAPIVNPNDPTLMFINAGMNPFKDVFTGDKPPSSPRVADTQKCLRVSGKHNDLEEVGHDTYHHTMFEMLGNWSFGDYFKAEAIEWAWQFLTEKCQIKPDDLYITVFGGDEASQLGPDTEAETLWLKWVAPERILPYGTQDNFWEMGETGPCGPSSEIHIDLREPGERARVPAKDLVNTGHPQVIEIWNLVFIQFNRKADGSLVPLKAKSIDTGMGLERLAMVLQGKTSTYDTDLFAPLFDQIATKTGIRYGQAEKTDIAQRVMVDHLRAIAFTIADGQLPSNTGAGYVIRRLIRRALRYGFQFLDVREPMLHTLLPGFQAEYGRVFPELLAQAELIQQVLLQEESSFLQTLERGTQRFSGYLAEHTSGPIAGAFAFELYDTYGFPLDLTQVMAREEGREVDLAGFAEAMAAQKSRSRQAAQKATGDWVELAPTVETVFLGYHDLTAETRILKYRAVEDTKGTHYQVVLDQTPFYPEGGGQLGDTGTLTQRDAVVRITNTNRENTLIIHSCPSLPDEVSGPWVAKVDPSRRERLSVHHTATHLVHAALRETLGTHVEQRGSLVAPGYLRFDFSHFQPVSGEEISQIENRVNEQISAALPREIYSQTPYEEALAMGAMALFGEKYGDTVRVVRFGENFSTELCGGTHVANSRDLRMFRITQETAVAAGIRRLEAVAGAAAVQLLMAQSRELLEARRTLKVKADVPQAIDQLQHKLKLEEKRVTQLGNQLADLQTAQLAQFVKRIGGIELIAKQVEASSADTLRRMAMALSQENDNRVVLLAALLNEKPLLALAISSPLTETRGFSAKDWIKPIASHIKGGGGGQPSFASAGGKHPQGLPNALVEIEELVNTHA